MSFDSNEAAKIFGEERTSWAEGEELKGRSEKVGEGRLGGRPTEQWEEKGWKCCTCGQPDAQRPAQKCPQWPPEEVNKRSLLHLRCG